MKGWPTTPSRAALVLDFDGTLAPIVDDPTMSALPEATGAVLTRLAAGLGRLAVVSGRPASFLAERIDVPGLALYGLYGLEELRDGVIVPHAGVRRHEHAIGKARRRLQERALGWQGVHVEDKGRAVAVHWRNAPDRQHAGTVATAAVTELAAELGLAVEPGKLVVELRPPVGADKGTAFEQVTEGFEEVAFAGDDVGDLPAFRATRAKGGLAVAIDHGPETPAEVLAAATHVVAGTTGLVAWLEDLAARLES